MLPLPFVIAGAIVSICCRANRAREEEVEAKKNELEMIQFKSKLTEAVNAAAPALPDLNSILIPGEMFSRFPELKGSTFRLTPGQVSWLTTVGLPKINSNQTFSEEEASYFKGILCCAA